MADLPVKQIKDLDLLVSPAATDKVPVQDAAGKTWYATVSGVGSGGSGDMTAAVYDPTSVADDAFDVDNHASGSTNKVFTGTEQTKLSGIETAADVTDTANVTSAGALMDSEVDADLKTFALPASTTISVFGATLVDDAAASNARTTLGVAIGTDVLAEQTIGIADNNLVEVDHSTTAASGEMARFTASGLESRSNAEMKVQLGYMVDLSDDTTPTLGGVLAGGGNDQTGMGTISMTEQAAANADVAGDGQLWVKTATPNQLWFTDDGGTDVQLGAGGAGDAWSDPVDAVITPDADGTRDLGLTGTRFATGYFDELAITGDITFGPGPQFIDTNGSTAFYIDTTTTGVNFLSLKGAAAGAGPRVAAEGSDTNVDLLLRAQGTGEVEVSFSDLNVSGGDILVSGTVDGRDIDADGTTLDDLPVANLNGGTGATASTWWRGDGTWAAPSGSGDMVLADVQTVTGAKTFGTIGGAVGKFILAGSTSGSTIVNATAAAGATTLTLPAATDTLVGKATTDTLTNKTLTSPTLTTPALGTPASGVMTNVTGTAASLTAGSVTNFTPASGSLTLSGADALTLTTTAATNVTLPTTGTLAVEDDLSKYVGQNLQTGTTYTLVLTDAGKMVEMNNASANTLTVPPNSSVAFPVDTRIDITQYGAGLTTVAQGSGVTIRGELVSLGQYEGLSLWKRATDEWVIYGGTT